MLTWYEKKLNLGIGGEGSKWLELRRESMFSSSPVHHVLPLFGPIT
jgi:hypothetical protein